MSIASYRTFLTSSAWEPAMLSSGEIEKITAAIERLENARDASIAASAS